MDQIRAMLNRLPELSDDELTELEGAIVSEFGTVEKQDPTQEIIDAMTELADAAESVRNEVTRRAEAAASMVQKHEELANRIRGAKTDESAPVIEDVAPVEDVPAEIESPVEDAAPDEEDEDPLKKKVPMAAAVEASDDAEPETPEAVTADASDEAADEVAEEPEANEAEEPEAADEAVEEADAPEVEAAEAEAYAPEAEAAEAEVDSTPQDTNPSTPTEDPVTASAEGGELIVSEDVQPPADRLPRVTTAPVTITAGADIPGVSAGSPLDSMDDVASAMIQRMHTMRRVSGGDGEQHTVATLVASFPEERILRPTDPEENARKIADVLSPEAIMASGGWCAPLEVRYDVFDTGGSTDRPVRDALSPFTADRGGIRYMTAPKISDLAGAVDVWTAATDLDPQSETKTCLTVSCGTPVDVSLDAITLCLTFGNMASRAYPELVARQNQLGMVNHARFAENRILSSMETGSTAVTAAQALSAVRDFLVQVDKAAAAYRFRHRLDTDFPLRLVAPEWMRNLIRADLTMQMPGDGQDSTFAAADNIIDNFLRVRHINVTWHKDGSGFGSQGAGALVSFPSTTKWFLFAEGTWLFLDGGTLDLGLVRDSTLNGTNDYQMFLETFEAVAKVGVESLCITSTLTATGLAAALIDAVPTTGPTGPTGATGPTGPTGP